MKTKNSTGPGRPAYQVKWPTGKFTFTQLMERNGVNPKTGKGKDCTRLTLYKHLQVATKGTKSEIVRIKDETRKPNSKTGMGRKAFVYIRREKLNGMKAASKSRVSVKLNNKANDNTSASYEATKAALLAPTPAPTPAPEPVMAPVAEAQSSTPEVVTATETVSAPVTAEQPQAIAA